jgi:hypothetical protein
MRASLRTAVLALLAARPASAQIRIEPLTPRLPPASAAMIAPSSLFTPSLAAPVPAAAPAALAAPMALSSPAALPAADALPRAAAAVAGPQRPGASPAAALTAFWDGAAASDGPVPADAPPEEPPSRSINSFWSGFGDYEDVSGVRTLGADDETDDGSAAPWLVLKDLKFAAAMDAAVTLARTTDAGRRALDAAEKALAAEGRTLSVDVKDLGRNWGEYDYLDGRMRLHRRLFEKGREAELAGTLTHELLHVAQHAAGLPSNALELEIEAHLQDLALMNELGLRAPPNTFARQTEEALKKGPAAFIALIQMAVPGSPFLGESSFADIVDQLEQDLDSASGRRGPRAEKYASAIERDLKSLRSKKGRAAYKTFSDRVLEELKRRAAAVS